MNTEIIIGFSVMIVFLIILTFEDTISSYIKIKAGESHKHKKKKGDCISEYLLIIFNELGDISPCIQLDINGGTSATFTFFSTPNVVAQRIFDAFKKNVDRVECDEYGCFIGYAQNETLRITIQYGKGDVSNTLTGSVNRIWH